eukprot:GHVU01013425.1.p1 GENE.GHVU01013425.1~~GHVU01013425.1.p1  ORF type:complete len:128 (-),score=9.15 GHVU01013425.1:198-581(-)
MGRIRSAPLTAGCPELVGGEFNICFNVVSGIMTVIIIPSFCPSLSLAPYLPPSLSIPLSPSSVVVIYLVVDVHSIRQQPSRLLVGREAAAAGAAAVAPAEDPLIGCHRMASMAATLASMLFCCKRRC